MMQKDKSYIAFVCTGNTCRSPMAEGIFNKLAAEKSLGIAAESFGVSTMTGMPVSENSVKACAEIDVDLSKKTSVFVVDADLEKYEKFYCMSQRHAEILTKLCGVDAKKTAVLNVLDPYGGSLEVYRRCRDEIYNFIKEIIKEIIKEYED